MEKETPSECLLTKKDAGMGNHSETTHHSQAGSSPRFIRRGIPVSSGGIDLR
jgi:hypothetical protein